MQEKTKSILEELNMISLNKECHSQFLIESRAINIIESAINLITLVHNTYDKTTAIDLERRLINSIKGQDSTKFKRGIKKITDKKQNNEA